MFENPFGTLFKITPFIVKSKFSYYLNISSKEFIPNAIFRILVLSNETLAIHISKLQQDFLKPPAN